MPPDGTPEVGTYAVQSRLNAVEAVVKGVTAMPGAAGGVATLDGAGRITDAQLPPTGTELVVAASNAPDRIKARADYVCDGTADEAQINDAVAAISLFGGRVRLTEGWFTIDSDIIIDKDNVALLGTDKGQPLGSEPAKGGSLIIRSASFSGTCGINVDPAAADRVLYGVTLQDFSIDGMNIGAAADGILFRAARSTIRNVWVTRWTGNGIAAQSHTFAVYPKASHDNLIENVRVDDCTLNGMSFTNGSTDNLIRNCIVTSCGGDGIACTKGATPCTANMLIGNYIYSNLGNAISGPLYQTQILGNRIQDCNGGIYLDNTTAGAGGFTIVGNIIRNCSIAADNTTDGINIACTAGAARGGLITSNAFHTDPGDENAELHRMRYGINIVGSTVRDVVVGPQSQGFREASSCFGTAMLNDAGTGTTYQMADRITLKAEGDATVGQVAYGTGAVPTTFLRAARGTILAPLRVKSADVLGRWGATGATAATDEAAAAIGTNPRALIEVLASEDFTSTAQGTSMLFKTTTTGGTSTNERFRLQAGEGIDFQQASFATYMMRLKNNAVVMGRNAANNANVSLLKINASDQLELMTDVLFTASKKLGFYGKAPASRPNVKAAAEVTAKELCEALETVGLIE
jgi:hypothetical protein